LTGRGFGNGGEEEFWNFNFDNQQLAICYVWVTLGWCESSESIFVDFTFGTKFPAT